MYIPAHFEETDPHEIKDLISAYPLATLVANTAEGLVANHMPLIADGDDKLIGHFAMANDMWRLVDRNDEVMAIFRGEDAYVSPNWYPSKAEHHKQVPTWNYQVVHVYGKLKVIESVKFRRKVVGLLTKYFEKKTNGEAAWRMADAPKEYTDDMLDNIVGFEIEIARVLAKSKVGQNKSIQDIAGVTREMETGGHHALANRMKKALSDN